MRVDHMIGNDMHRQGSECHVIINNHTAGCYVKKREVTGEREGFH
jgi:hypothetical protein